VKVVTKFVPGLLEVHYSLQGLTCVYPMGGRRRRAGFGIQCLHQDPRDYSLQPEFEGMV
jgi:hypothetical protein